MDNRIVYFTACSLRVYSRVCIWICIRIQIQIGFRFNEFVFLGSEFESGSQNRIQGPKNYFLLIFLKQGNKYYKAISIQNAENQK
jgi:hypothetical protein